MKLKDKVAIVTGGTAGIGKETARRFSQEGAHVFIMGRCEVKGKALEKELVAQGGKAFYFKSDVTCEDEMKAAVKKANDLFGAIDILFNCAGTAINGTIEDVSPDDWDYIFNVNVKGPYYLSREVLPYMRKRGKGVIINVASTAGVVGAPFLHAYSATKGALIQMTKSMACSYAEENIRVNALCPGATQTEMMDSIDQSFLNRIPMKRMATVEEIAGTAAFIASDDAGFITGATILSDGGFTAI